jgi:hypothetical protein
LALPFLRPWRAVRRNGVIDLNAVDIVKIYVNYKAKKEKNNPEPKSRRGEKMTIGVDVDEVARWWNCRRKFL